MPGAAAPVEKPAALLAIDLEELPPGCHDLGKVANAPSPARAQSARIALANCIVEHELRTIPICDCEQSVRDIDGASMRSIQLLDEVHAAGDATMKILARQALGDLLSSFAMRVVAAVPPLAGTSEAAIALRDMRLALLEPVLEPWLTRARAAYVEVDQLARANPQLVRNAAVAAAVRASRTKLAQPAGVTAKR